MTVAELIDKLKAMPQDAEAWVVIMNNKACGWWSFIDDLEYVTEPIPENSGVAIIGEPVDIHSFCTEHNGPRWIGNRLNE